MVADRRGGSEQAFGRWFADGLYRGLVSSATQAISALNPSKSLEKCLKFGENWRNIQKIYHSVKKRTSRRMSLCLIALESNANLPDLAAREDGWEVESLIVPYEVLLVWNHSTSREGWVYCSNVSQRALNPSFWWAVWYILSFSGHFLNIWQPKQGNRSAV